MTNTSDHNEFLSEDFLTHVSSEPVPKFSEGERVYVSLQSEYGRVTGAEPYRSTGGANPPYVYQVNVNGIVAEYPEYTLSSAPLPKLPLTDILELLDDAIRDHFTRVMSCDIGGHVEVEINYSGSAGENEFKRECMARINYETDSRSCSLQAVLDESINRALWKERNKPVYLPKYR